MAAAEEEGMKDVIQSDEQETSPAETGVEAEGAAEPSSGGEPAPPAIEDAEQGDQGDQEAEGKEMPSAEEAGGEDETAGADAEAEEPGKEDSQGAAEPGVQEANSEEEEAGGDANGVATAEEEGKKQEPAEEEGKIQEPAEEGENDAGEAVEAPQAVGGDDEDKGEAAEGAGEAGEEKASELAGGQEEEEYRREGEEETLATEEAKEAAGEDKLASTAPAGGPEHAEDKENEDGGDREDMKDDGDERQKEEPTFDEVMAAGDEQAMEEQGAEDGSDLDRMVDAALDKNSQVMSRASVGREQLRISDSDPFVSHPMSRAEQGPSASSQQLQSRIAQLEAQLEASEQGRDRAEAEAWERQEEMSRVLSQKEALQAEVKALRGQMELELNARREAADRMWADMSEEAVQDGGKPQKRMEEQATNVSAREEDSDFIDPPRSRFPHQPFTFGEEDRDRLIPQHDEMQEVESKQEELPGGEGASSAAGERLKEELMRKNELILELRIQVGQLENQLRSAQDMNQFRSEMEIERIRQDAEWQRRMAMEEIARMRHELEIANSKKSRLKELLADNLHELRDQRRQSEMLKAKISGLFGKMENITRQFVQEQSFLRDFQNVRQSIDEIKKESEMQLESLDLKHKDFVNVMRADMQNDNPPLLLPVREPIRQDVDDEEDYQPRGPQGPGPAPRRRQEGMRGGERKAARGQGMPGVDGKQKPSPSKKVANDVAGQLRKEESLLQQGDRMDQHFLLPQQRPMFGFPMPMQGFYPMPHVPGDPFMMPDSKQQAMGYENFQFRRGGLDPPQDVNDAGMLNNFPPGYPQMPMFATPYGMPVQHANPGMQHLANPGDAQVASPARRMNAQPLDPEMQQYMEDDWWRAPGEAQAAERADKAESFLPAIDGGGRGNKGRTPPPLKKDVSRAQQIRNPKKK